ELARIFPTAFRHPRRTPESAGVLLNFLPARVLSGPACLSDGGTVKSLLDPTFKYIPSVETDIRKTFARVRREARRDASAVAPSSFFQPDGSAGEPLQPVDDR